MFADAYYKKEAGGIYITYRTGSTVYEECFTDGDLFPCGWNPAGFVPQTITVPGTPRLNPPGHITSTAFSLEADGQDLFAAYEWEGFEKTEENGLIKVAIKLKSTVAPIEVTVNTHLDKGDILVRFLTVKNCSDEPVRVSGLTVMGGALLERRLKNNEEDPPFEVGYIQNSQSAYEGSFRWQKLPRNTFSFGKKLYGERYRNPFFVLRSMVSPHLVIGELAYSGGYEFSFDNMIDAHSSHDSLSFRCAIHSRNPLYVLSANEKMTTPAMHIGMIHGGLDDGIQALHRHIFDYCSSYEKHGLVEASIGPEVDMCKENVFKAIDNAQKVGAEVFFIDASWYSPPGGESEWPAYTGDWSPENWRYSCSMEDFKSYAAERGMKFGLWMDIEKLGPKSKALQNPEIPKLHDYAGRLTIDGQSGILDVSQKAGCDWAFEQICNVIDRYKLDFFRLDSGSYSYTSARNVAGTRENSDLRYYSAFYDLFKRLRRKYPDVIFQNCAGGGARLDLGMIEPMSNTWITDMQVAPYSFPIINGVSMMLPPAYLVRPFGAQNGHLEGTLDFQINMVRFGNPLICCVPPYDVEFSPDMLDKVAKSIQTYKQVIRPMLTGAKVYHHTPQLDLCKDDCVGILETAAEDGHCSMLGVFTLSKVLTPVSRVCMKGVSPEGRYSVTVNDEFYGEFSGKELKYDGISVEIERPLDSKVFIASRID